MPNATSALKAWESGGCSPISAIIEAPIAGAIPAVLLQKFAGGTMCLSGREWTLARISQS
jgi:hypothetical protein